MSSICILLTALGLSTGAANQAAPVVPLVGSWRLNSDRTHYGPGVDVRRSEFLMCGAKGDVITCRIESIRHNGRRVFASFTARLGGPPAPVKGVDGIDQVILARSGANLDATFLSHGRGVYGYRAFGSRDGNCLVVVSVEPASRVVLTTVVVYERALERSSKPPDSR